jgi:hypothetical protein
MSADRGMRSVEWASRQVGVAALEPTPNPSQEGNWRGRGCMRKNLFRSPILLSAVTAQANGARTSVRWNVGRQRALDISQRKFAVLTFLRDQSRAPIKEAGHA